MIQILIVQWKLFIADADETAENALIGEVSLFHGYFFYLHVGGTIDSVLINFRGVLVEGFHCNV